MGLYLAVSCAPLLLMFICLGLGWEESDLSGFLWGGAFEQAGYSNVLRFARFGLIMPV